MSEDIGPILTVGELIEKLRAFPAEKHVAIRDADTSWALTVYLEDEGDGCFLAIGGGYSDAPADHGIQTRLAGDCRRPSKAKGSAT